MTAAGFSIEAELWREHAACASTDDPGLWFPIGHNLTAMQQAAEAKAICRGCPVRGACLDYALAHNIDDGIWGGLNEQQRRSARRVRRRETGGGALTAAHDSPPAPSAGHPTGASPATTTGARPAT